MTQAKIRADEAATTRTLSPEALRALAEAAERRASKRSEAISSPRELGGRGGLDPARYGDWESRGIASDF